ncbi:hypothetical protein Igag_0050 [Ignisphaera aggregans DSM 17230]|uniref:Uncharacterized protein n=1 Tax=Ignisphaera aggregans (strain DSM 17230 / JCM 13409 / AQ1.S1) TaxID=583356 RepID=E0SPG0_IGNAA|nr:hypothetical protein Igag_0050 [Ignisphaera aggregans DSM 17230]
MLMADNVKRVVMMIAKILRDINIVNGVEPSDLMYRVAVQKIGYLLQKIGGEDLGLRFEWLTMGPYSRSLQNHYYTIARLISNGDIELVEHDLQIVNRVEHFISMLREAIGYLDIQLLEIVASLIMICTDIYPKVDDPANELINRKRNVSRDIVERVLHFLKGNGICV